MLDPVGNEAGWLVLEGVWHGRKKGVERARMRMRTTKVVSDGGGTPGWGVNGCVDVRGEG